VVLLSCLFCTTKLRNLSERAIGFLRENREYNGIISRNSGRVEGDLAILNVSEADFK